MKINCYGKPEKPAVLLLSGGDVTPAELYEALKALESRYCLLIPDWEGQSGSECIEALEEYLGREFSGRIWGAYALRENSETLAALLAREHVRIRTSILDSSVSRQVPEGLGKADTKLYFWLGSKNGPAKRSRRAYKHVCPGMRTLTIRKFGKDDYFLRIRPDLMVKRLTKTFGKAQQVSRSVVLPAGEAQIWEQLAQQPQPRAAELLKENDEVVVDEDDRTRISGGRGGVISRWSHLTRLDPVSETETLCTEQIEVAAGPLSGAVRLWANGYLLLRQRRIRKELKAQDAAPRAAAEEENADSGE